ncbi:MAG: efflux RND transporter periplasmic adaptor subunit [Planctomycetaceae bacterium]|nr:efflux RND transporter periplasmic adaptor subunit [Planctomycetaceae bacterium]
MVAKPVRSFITFASPYVSTVAVLATLGGIGLWGHINHWKLSHADSDHHPAPAAVRFAESAKTADTPELATAAHASPAAPATPRAADPAPAAPTPDPTAVDQLELGSHEAVVKAGIEMVEARQTPMDHSVVATGVIDYNQTRVAQLSSRVPGIAWRVEKRAGQAVHNGDVLAIVEAVDVGTAKSEFLKALAQMELKAKVLARLDPTVVAARQIHEVEAQLREARIAVFTAQQNLVNLGLPISTDEFSPLSDEERAAKMRFLGLPAEIVAELDPERTTANLLPLIAPFDGVVISREMVVGEAVATTEPQFIVADVEKMWIKLDVRQEDALQLKIGQEVKFRPDGIPNEVSSTVSWIATEVDPKTRTVEVRAIVDNPLVQAATPQQAEQRLLRANTFGTGLIRVSENSHAVVVPNQAIQWDGNNHVVFVNQEGARFESRKVAIGCVDDNDSEILSGIQVGERVVTVGSHVIKSEILRRRIANAGG